MKTRIYAIALILASPLVVRGSQPDHLLPVDLHWSPKFRAILAEKLCQTPFNCSRMVVKPSFVKPEESISVYSRKLGAGPQTYSVTYIVAQENIWDPTNGGDFPERAKNIKVRRIDAEIAQRTAELIRQVWNGMLSGPQTPRKWPVPPELLYTDATIGEFSTQVSPINILYGETPMVPDLGRKTKELIGISEGLIKYCKAKAVDRPVIVSQIEHKASALLAELRQ